MCICIYTSACSSSSSSSKLITLNIHEKVHSAQRLRASSSVCSSPCCRPAATARRPAVPCSKRYHHHEGDDTARALAALTRSPTHDPLMALGPGTVALLSAILDAVRRCNVTAWLPVLGVIFLSDDPWSVDAGRVSATADVDRAVAAMRTLFDSPALLTEVSVHLARRTRDAETFASAPFAPAAEDPDPTPDGSTSAQPDQQHPPRRRHLRRSGGIDGEEENEDTGDESFAELRCRVAALQLQMDDVTAVVRRNERITKDLLSSFHFWSLLLLDELRSYRSAANNNSHSQTGVRSPQISDGVIDNLTQRMGRIVTGAASPPHSSTLVPPFAPERSVIIHDEAIRPAENRSPPLSTSSSISDNPRPRRVFRDGKWIVQ